MKIHHPRRTVVNIQHGFTLVEISIVMIIIGLLIGGTFGGMKLIENMQVNKTVQDLKAIESATLTFKDTYGRLPGDIVNPAARLPNCTTAPCSTGGNGDRAVDNGIGYSVALTATAERFTFWHHLSATDLLSAGVKNTTDMNFGEGQPESPLGAGYRNMRYNGGPWYGTRIWQGTALIITSQSSAILVPSGSMPSKNVQSIDLKMDDGKPHDGLFQAWGCTTVTGTDPEAPYVITLSCDAVYDYKGF